MVHGISSDAYRGLVRRLDGQSTHEFSVFLLPSVLRPGSSFCWTFRLLLPAPSAVFISGGRVGIFGVSERRRAPRPKTLETCSQRRFPSITPRGVSQRLTAEYAAVHLYLDDFEVGTDAPESYHVLMALGHTKGVLCLDRIGDRNLIAIVSVPWEPSKRGLVRIAQERFYYLLGERSMAFAFRSAASCCLAFERASCALSRATASSFSFSFRLDSTCARSCKRCLPSG